MTKEDKPLKETPPKRGRRKVSKMEEDKLFNKPMKVLLLLVIALGLGIALMFIFNQIEKMNGRAIDSREIIIVPVKAQIVISENEKYTSFRTEEEIVELINVANEIWKQAGISFSLEEIVVSNVEMYDISMAINEDYSNLVNNENYDKKRINLLFVGSLNGINGLSWLQGNIIFIADNTSVSSSRTIAHEFGHLLGLKHIDGENNLMSQGYSGEFLNDWEIEIVRSDTRNFIQ